MTKSQVPAKLNTGSALSQSDCSISAVRLNSKTEDEPTAREQHQVRGNDGENKTSRILQKDR